MQLLATIGYQGRSLENLVTTLQSNEVDLVLDIRERAWSRKPGFSKYQLRGVLQDRGIDYVHEPRLGSPSVMRAAYRANGDWSVFDEAYRQHLGTLTELIDEYALQLAGRRCCLLCFEEQATLCHRFAVAEVLASALETVPTHL